eukprot:TRINITY_DN21119_c0_g2_i3.p1 TRINITY_DN21119_c0_g2~~TRINITY_DN21119_c0_g2_i3.p1  ORF type:complete len:200 (+),score=-13.72 TRINITY_DN21119_c0_g2_i3:481-1080(+)
MNSMCQQVDYKFNFKPVRMSLKSRHKQNPQNKYIQKQLSSYIQTGNFENIVILFRAQQCNNKSFKAIGAYSMFALIQLFNLTMDNQLAIDSNCVESVIEEIICLEFIQFWWQIVHASFNILHVTLQYSFKDLIITVTLSLYQMFTLYKTKLNIFCNSKWIQDNFYITARLLINCNLTQTVFHIQFFIFHNFKSILVQLV